MPHKRSGASAACAARSRSIAESTPLRHSAQGRQPAVAESSGDRHKCVMLLSCMDSATRLAARAE